MFKNYVLPSVNIKNQTIESTDSLIIDALDLHKKINSHGGSEAYYCLYDFEPNKPLTGYRGLHRPALNYTVFDLDSEDLELSLSEARTLCAFFIKKGFEPKLITPYFSGSKGFHIYLHASVMDAQASQGVSYKVKKSQEALAYKLELKTIDLGIHNAIRKFRLPRSKHPKTGLFKTELTLKELASLDIPKIKQLSQSQRPCTLDRELYTAKKPLEIKLPERIPVTMLPAKPLTPYVEALHFGSENLLECDLPKTYPTNTPCSLALEEQPVYEGQRHYAILLFIQNLYHLGLSKSEAEERLIKVIKARGFLDKLRDSQRMLNDAYTKNKIYTYNCDEPVKKAFCKTSCPIHKSQQS